MLMELKNSENVKIEINSATILAKCIHDKAIE